MSYENTTIRLISRKSVETITGLSRSTIYAKMSDNTFPKNVHVGPKSVRWVYAEVIAWIESVIKKRT
jgi:prophage regulatory protein